MHETDAGADAGSDEEDAGVMHGDGNHIGATIDGLDFRYSTRMTAPTEMDGLVMFRAYGTGQATTYWSIAVPTAVGTYSCAEDGEASVSHLDQGGLGGATAYAGAGDCTMEVTSAGPVWKGTFSGALYQSATEKEVTEGSFEFDADTAPGGGATAFPDAYKGVLLSVAEPTSLADTYLVKQTRSEVDAGLWLFGVQNILTAPEFQLTFRNIPSSVGTSTCASDGLKVGFTNNINGSAYWETGGSCSVELTKFSGGEAEGTFSAELPGLGHPGMIKISGQIRASYPE